MDYRDFTVSFGYIFVDYRDFTVSFGYIFVDMVSIQHNIIYIVYCVVV